MQSSQKVTKTVRNVAGLNQLTNIGMGVTANLLMRDRLGALYSVRGIV
jgi:hypothetical protein